MQRGVRSPAFFCTGARREVNAVVRSGAPTDQSGALALGFSLGEIKLTACKSNGVCGKDKQEESVSRHNKPVRMPSTTKEQKIVSATIADKFET
jgi:hypothetical protein